MRMVVPLMVSQLRTIRWCTIDGKSKVLRHLVPHTDTMVSPVRTPLAEFNPIWTTAIITAVAYGIVLGTFYDLLPIFPELSRETIDLLSHVTAVANLVTIVSLVVGWYWVKQRELERHAGAMVVATLSILVFLVLYLTRIGGGGQKALAGDPHVAIELSYLFMLGVHILLSMIAVPLVVFALVLALSHPLNELGRTKHPQIGRYAAITWLVSLILGIGAYLILNHLVGAELAA